jgi:hypothetical protein
VTHLRKLTLDEIARRNYSEGTTRTYVRIIEDLARYFHRSPDQLDPSSAGYFGESSWPDSGNCTRPAN